MANYSTWRKTRELDCLIAKEVYNIDSSWEENPMYVPGIGETVRATPWTAWPYGGFSLVELYHSDNDAALNLIRWLEAKMGAPVEALFSNGRVFVRAGATYHYANKYHSDQPTLPEAVCEIVVNYLTDQKKSV